MNLPRLITVLALVIASSTSAHAQFAVQGTTTDTPDNLSITLAWTNVFPSDANNPTFTQVLNNWSITVYTLSDGTNYYEEAIIGSTNAARPSFADPYDALLAQSIPMGQGLVTDAESGIVTANGKTDSFSVLVSDGVTRTLQISGNIQLTGSTDKIITVNTAPVPEPESYMMILAGIGLMGFVASRRRARG